MSAARAHGPRPVIVPVVHVAGQFSDDRDQHQHDAEAIFDYAVETGVWIMGGTEAADTPSQHGAHPTIVRAAARHDFVGNFTAQGEWVAVNRRFLRMTDHGYISLIPATHGLSAGQGGHSERGIAWLTAEALDVDLGALSVGESHWNTERSNRASGTTNAPMVEGARKWGHEHGAGSDIALYFADTNEDDLRGDPLGDAGFTTLADELGEHPATHGLNTERGSRIDVIATLNQDGRVKGHDYRVLDDRALRLFYDHFLLRGELAITPRP